MGVTRLNRRTLEGGTANVVRLNSVALNIIPRGIEEEDEVPWITTWEPLTDSTGAQIYDASGELIETKVRKKG